MTAVTYLAANATSCSLSLSGNSTKDSGDEFLAMLTEKFAEESNDRPGTPVEYIEDVLGNLGQGLTGGLGFDTDGDNVITGKELSAVATADFADFQYMLDSALEEAGISKDPAFEITSGASGRLYINGEHPDKARIEEILNGVPQLQQTYARMSSTSSILAAGQRAQEFSALYEIDPQAAVNKYRYLFEEESNDIFSIFVSDDGYDASLNSYGKDFSFADLLGGF